MSENRTRSLLLALGVFAAAKFKWILALLKWSKFGGTLLSMAISMGGYAVVYGWRFGAVLIYLIFIHEMGHVIAAKKKGIRTSPAIFIPFVGAFIGMKEQPRDAQTEAYLAYGGPLAGLLSFLPAVPLYLLTGEPLWGLTIFMGAALNLFNLLPVSPLDGGRIVSVLSTRIWFLGLLLLGALVILAPSPMPILLLLIGFLTWWARLREGYRRSVLLYEKSKLEDYQTVLRQVTDSLDSPFSSPSTQWNTAAALEPTSSPPERKWFIPFVHDKEKLQRDRQRLDLQYAEKARVWAEEMKTAEDALERSIEEAEQQMNQLEKKLLQLHSYYDSPASVKWKVLCAYLGLTLVLILFSIYGFSLMELHNIQLSKRA
ncbi:MULTISPECIES: site-2 protease family protein [Paenibacillus]|uniref:site-2 protease family protein n=1 Tax=Paenibacillus TaxID=44249 RepID=UPI0022B88C3D|nr:site-2 protease family protein [Paenibacillus caseinilyticus]MCZ8519628.1 site-2 protease family protein [Paenibacillus caseinilyticus]